jgi:hypothetical protein
MHSFSKWKAAKGSIATATCTSNPNITDTIAPAEFESEDRFCQAQTQEEFRCEAGGACVPQAGDGFEEGLCIYRDGEHECPAESPYSERRVLHSSLIDNRECSTCQCEAPSGTCTGKLLLQESCSNPSFSTELSYCGTKPETTATRVVYDVDPLPCTAQGGEMTGNAEPSNPITICCLAPAE